MWELEWQIKYVLILLYKKEGTILLSHVFEYVSGVL